MKTLSYIFKQLYNVIIFIPKLLYAFILVWVNSSEAQKRQYRSAFFWLIILIFGPFAMLWESCPMNSTAMRKKALIEINLKGVNTLTKDEINYNYEYGLEHGWFDEHPELKKY